jgi:SprT-like family
VIATDAGGLARQLMDQHGLQDWSVTINRRLERIAGQCDHKRKTIHLGDFYVAENDEGEVRDTILHEIAHALHGPGGQPHGREWKEIARNIGARPQAHTAEPDFEPSAEASKSLAENEAAIERSLENGRAALLEIGRRLQAIRDGRLYRSDECPTFEWYLWKRWSLGRPDGYRFIDAAQVAEILSPNGDVPLPTHESHFRELARLKAHPDQLREAWKATVEVGAPTAHIVRDQVSQRLWEIERHEAAVHRGQAAAETRRRRAAATNGDDEVETQPDPGPSDPRHARFEFEVERIAHRLRSLAHDVRAAKHWVADDPEREANGLARLAAEVEAITVELIPNMPAAPEVES